MAKIVSAIRGFFCLLYNSFRWPVLATALAAVPALAVYYSQGDVETPLQKGFVLAAGFIGLAFAVWANRTSISSIGGLGWAIVAAVLIAVPGYAVYFYFGGADTPMHKILILGSVLLTLWLAVSARNLIGVVLLAFGLIALFRVVDYVTST